MVNVRDYGARGDGSTDDTAAIQAALNASTASSPKPVYLPAGTYRVTAQLNVPYAPGTSILGDGSVATIVRQDTGGTPIVSFGVPDTHSVVMRDLSLAYGTQQTASDIDGIAVKYQTPGGSFNGFYHHVYERMGIHGAAVGFGISTNAGERQTVWHSSWSNVNLFRTAVNCFRFTPSVTIGMPANQWRNIGVFNPSTLGATGAAWKLSGCETLIDGLDIEGWSSPILDATGGKMATVRNVRIDHHVAQGQSTYLFLFADSCLTLRHIECAISVTATGEVALVRGLAGSTVDVDQIQMGASDGPAFVLSDRGGTKYIVGQFVKTLTSSVSVLAPGVPLDKVKYL